MNKSDYIQAAIALIYLVLLVLVLVQLIVQNRVLKAQLLRDRFETYWKIWEPVSDAHVKELQLFSDDYIDRNKYESRYKNDESALRKYLYMLTVYEFLVFSYAIRQAKLPDPLGHAWTVRWVRDLIQEPEFLDVHEYHKVFYPEFATFVDGLLKEASGRIIPS